MENVEKAMRMFSKDAKLSSITEAGSKYFNNGKGKEGEGIAAALSSSDQSKILISRPPRNMVSLWTCSKMCAFFFVAGVVVGYTLKQRVRRWASKLLKKLRDDL